MAGFFQRREYSAQPRREKRWRLKKKYQDLGITGLWLMQGHDFLNIVNQRPSSPGTGYFLSEYKGEAALNCTSTTSQVGLDIGNYDGQIGLSGADDFFFAVSAVCETATGGDEQALLGAFNECVMVWQDGTNNNLEMYLGSGKRDCPTTMQTWYNGGGWALHERHSIAIRFSNTLGTITWYEDGINHGNKGATGTLATASTNCPIGARGDTNGDNWRGKIFWAVIGTKHIADDDFFTRLTKHGPGFLLEPESRYIPPAVAGGVTVDVPLATFTLTGQVPTVAAGASVAVPLATFTLAGQAPTISTGIAVAVPLATFTLAGQVPTIEAGGGVGIAVPLATFTLAGQVPTVAAGASVAVPLATFTLTGQVPTIEASAALNIPVPLATFTLTGQVPSVAAGASVAVPLATFTLTGQVPTISITGAVEALPSMTIETDTDRLALMTHDNVTVEFAGTGYHGILAETDGLTLDGGTAPDGVFELQMRSSDVTAAGIGETDTVTISGTVYSIGKIDDIGGGMSVLYLEV